MGVRASTGRQGTFAAAVQALGTKTQQSTLHEGDHHLIERHKALLPAFEDENDDCSESNIDVGVDVD